MVETQQDPKPAYLRARFTPTWNGTECEYGMIASLRTEAEVKPYLIGRSTFPASQLGAQLRLSVSRALAQLPKRAEVETLAVINSADANVEPQLVYQSIVTMCSDSEAAMVGEVNIHARTGVVLGADWLNRVCE